MNVAGSDPLREFGLGTAGIGNLYRAIDDEEARRTMGRAAASGATYFDTAPHYGAGLSEQRIGAFISASEQAISISTKVGRVLRRLDGKPPHQGFIDTPPFESVFDYSASGIRESFEGSCARLGRTDVEALLLHDIGALVHGPAHGRVLQLALAESLPAMDDLKAAGRTAAIGLGVNEIEVCQEVLERRRVDLILLAGRYTLFEHACSLAFMNDCAANGIGVVIGGLFNSGLLVNPDPSKANYNYRPAPDWAIERARKLREVCAGFEVPLPAAALAFALAHPAVVSVIPGAQTEQQVAQIADWRAMEIPPAMWDALREAELIDPDAPVP